MPEKKDTRQKIIEAAIEIMGREGNLNATIRDIAGRANVNIASINYYFRSKEKLMEEVEQTIIEKTRDIYDLLFDEKVEVRERLVRWGDSLMKRLLDFPGLIYLIGSRFLEDDVTGSISEYMSVPERDLHPVIKELTGTDSEELLSFKVLQLISGVVYPVLIYSSTGKAVGQDINDSATRSRYLTHLVQCIECPASVKS